jgi:BASS family bile acid:Na+ symporter
MSVQRWVPILLQISIALSMFGLGLATRRGALLYLFRNPGQLLRSLVSMYLVMPLIALTLIAAFDFHPALEVALVALSVSPVSPLIPGKELKAGGRDAYAIGLLAITALLAVALVPAAIALMGRAFGVSPWVPPVSIAKVVLITVLAPLSAGILVRRLARSLAERITHLTQVSAGVLLALSALVLLIVVAPAIVRLIGDGAVLAIAAVVLVGLIIGHRLGGPAPEDRTVLAMSTVSRHPAVALAAAAAAAPQQALTGAAVVLYLLISSLGAAVYARFLQHRGAREVELPLPFPPPPRRK